jgi:hypothetical protein
VIDEALSRARGEQRFHVVLAATVTDDDLRRALLTHEPEIVHFSGHGTGRKGLVFEEAGEPLLIAAEVLADLFRLCAAHVKCVVLNACYSEVQAAAISAHVEFVIGMSRAIGDAAAIKFSTGFYDALASGRPVAEAFQFGCNAISLKGIPESLTPVLMVRGQPGPPRNPAAQVMGGGDVAAQVHPTGQPIDPSLCELISLLDFRADMILSAFEQEGKDLETAGRRSGRDLVVGNPENDPLAARVRRAARLFEELHEKNKKALAERAFIRSHEITGQIRQLLEEVKLHVDFRVHGLMFPGVYFEGPPKPWWFVKDYPGVLPSRLTDDLAVRSLAEGWAASVATPAGKPPAEETSPSLTMNSHSWTARLPRNWGGSGSRPSGGGQTNGGNDGRRTRRLWRLAGKPPERRGFSKKGTCALGANSAMRGTVRTVTIASIVRVDGRPRPFRDCSRVDGSNVGFDSFSRDLVSMPWIRQPG